MKNLFLLLLLCLSLKSFSQGPPITYTPQTAAGYQFKYIKADSGLIVAFRDTTTGRGDNKPGSIVCRPQDSLFYGWNGLKWERFGKNSTIPINKVDSVTISGDTLKYWINGSAYGWLLPNNAAWKVTGNVGVCDGCFLGTLDAAPLVFRVDNVEQGRLTNTGGAAYGLLSEAHERQGTAVGANSLAKSPQSTAIGANTEAAADSSTAIGYGASSHVNHGVVLGDTLRSKVGIRTGNPEYPLDVRGSVRIKDGTEGIGKVLVDTDGNGLLGFQTVTGTGTVTSVGTGYGLIGGAITTTGVIVVDTATLSGKYVRIGDTTSMLNHYLRKSDTVSRVRLIAVNGDSLIYYSGSTRTALYLGAGGGGPAIDTLWTARRNADYNELAKVQKIQVQTRTGIASYTYKNVLVSDDSSNLYFKDIKWQPASQRYAGYVKKEDKKRIDIGGINPAGYSAVTNGLRYDAFAFPTVIQDTAYIVYKSGTTHVAPGYIPLKRSVDGGMTWDSINIVSTNGNNASLTGINDTLFLSYENYPTTNYQYFGYSADFGRTIVITDSIDIPTLGSVTFGKFIELPSGKKIICYYGYGSSWIVGFFESTDGLNWSVGNTIASGSNGAVELNETWVEVINPDATTDSEVKFIAVARNEGVNGEHIQYKSTGGVTWDRVGKIDQFKTTDDIYGYPMEVVLYGGKVYIIGFRRKYNTGGSNYDFNIGVSSAIPNEVFSDSSKWSIPNRIYNAEGNYTQKGFSNDCGYGFTFLLNGRLLMSPFDVSPQNVFGDSTATRIFTMPVFQNTYAEYYQRTNQTITINTETIVNTKEPWLDTDNLYDSVTKLFTIKTDGWYNLNAIASYAAASTGTFHTIYIKQINPGYATANRIIATQTVQPTDNANFLRMELNRNVYLRAGEKLGFYTITDGTADELNNQGDFKNRATFIITKNQ